mmetsp:Transcript_30209/g.80884  ORF Transcript_30209/g.80884 Transcript_30209/m.80884 type:complete len:219 (-) Transcript_30209:217-873(-)
MGAPPPGSTCSRNGLSRGTGSEVSTFRRTSCPRRSRWRSAPAGPPTSVACAQQSGRSSSPVTPREASRCTWSSKACDAKKLAFQVPCRECGAAASRKPAPRSAALYAPAQRSRNSSSHRLLGNRPGQNEVPRPGCLERLCLRLPLAALLPTRPLDGWMGVLSNALPLASGPPRAGSPAFGNSRQQDFRLRRCFTIASSSSAADMVRDVSGSLSVTSVA